MAAMCERINTYIYIHDDIYYIYVFKFICTAESVAWVAATHVLLQ